MLLLNQKVQTKADLLNVVRFDLPPFPPIVVFLTKQTTSIPSSHPPSARSLALRYHRPLEQV